MEKEVLLVFVEAKVWLPIGQGRLQSKKSCGSPNENNP